MKIQTASGALTLRPPTRAQLDRVSAFVPLTDALRAMPAGAKYGLLMRQGREEAWAIEQRPLDVNVAHGPEAAYTNVALVLMAIPRYLKKKLPGVLMPCVYLRPKGKALSEVGIAYFGGTTAAEASAWRAAEPPAGVSAVSRPAGFGRMVGAFMGCLAEASAETGTYLFSTMETGHRPYGKLGTVLASFLIHGEDLYSLKVKPMASDPGWAHLRAAGIREVYSLPTVLARRSSAAGARACPS